MTPKEKAIEIYHQMLNAGKGYTSDYLAGQCAYIAVQTVIDATPEIINVREYWNEVKKELYKHLNYK